jgi:hypothetical protein
LRILLLGVSICPIILTSDVSQNTNLESLNVSSENSLQKIFPVHNLKELNISDNGLESNDFLKHYLGERFGRDKYPQH